MIGKKLTAAFLVMHLKFSGIGTGECSHSDAGMFSDKS